MAVEIKIPESGESISEVQIGEWRKSEGDAVEQDEIVVEIETDKASMELPAPAAGVLAKITKKTGESAEVGDVIGEIEEGEEKSKRRKPEKSKRDKAKPGEDEESEQEAKRKKKKKKPKKSAAEAEEDETEDDEQGAEEDIPDRVEVQPRVMQAARRALSEHGLHADDIEGTGPGGRVLKEDVLRHVEEASKSKSTKRTKEPARRPELKRDGQDREEEVVPMTTLRRRIAARLVDAQQTAALLTTFNEIDMSGVIALRERYGEPFQKRFDIKLGFMSFFVKTAVEALKRVPQVNAEIRDDNIVYRNYYDIGVAVATDHGLVVPVIPDADRLGFAEIERTIADLANRARDKKLSLEELQGGTFTISNGGVYGSLLSTPIVNPPQSGILGLHAIQDRPVAREKQVVIRPMMYVALTYDHRLIDGREAVTFLRHIKEAIETPSKILLEI